MSFEDFVLQAIERVLEWEIPEDAIGRAVGDQAALMAKIGPDQICASCLD